MSLPHPSPDEEHRKRAEVATEREAILKRLAELAEQSTRLTDESVRLQARLAQLHASPVETRADGQPPSKA